MKEYDFSQKVAGTLFDSLPPATQEFIAQKAKTYRLSHSQLRILCEIAIDLKMWGEGGIEAIWEDRPNSKLTLAHLQKRYQELRTKPKRYGTPLPKEPPRRISVEEVDKELGFGLCPVASPKTRCCNLWTLDVVESCGFDCSYCSIQSFYNQDRVVFNTNLKSKLCSLPIDPDQIYHIGTGQSSDSLMWGNRGGILEALIEFATEHPNVILELKTKSANVAYLLQHPYPPNIIVTWSLNPQEVVEAEERLSASLHERLQAAKAIHDRGRLVGFHFHPMIHYEGWRQGYGAIFRELLANFRPELVAMVSFGTLTFIKPVIKRLRQRAMASKVLQMPLVEAAGKLSYPMAVKRELFSFGYQELAPWHGKVFFYLCMEDPSLWQEIFGFDYPTNESFELAMKYSYWAKIQGLRGE
ncbi:MAG: hypothetical protein C6I00_04785 [Nitratiruptor sp.]|nr:hypothetical protein [Nitratiruptor sp.]NPA84225.1 hypothetical protein [Campylobacterota bacterium]